MNDAEGVSSFPNSRPTNHQTDQCLDNAKPQNPLPNLQTAPTVPNGRTPFHESDHDEDDARSVKADSEAETIIQSGREELSPEKRRVYRIEHRPEHNENRLGKNDLAGSMSPAGADSWKARKRKRFENDVPGDGTVATPAASRGSSRIPSPVPELKQERTEESGLTPTTRETPLPLSESVGVVKTSERVKTPGNETDEHAFQQDIDNKQHDRPHHPVLPPKHDAESNNFSPRRISQERSLSPAIRSHKRVTSRSHSSTHTHIQKKKRLPPPLLTDRRRNSSEDRESISSSASGSPMPLARRLASEYSATSPAKQMPPAKKQRDQNGRTRLARACAAQEVEAAKTRHAENPEDLNIPDNAGNTPLQIASLEGCAEIVKFLLDAGCDINTKNIDRDTPLIDAVENGHLEVVRLLLDAGANPRVGNAEGDEPYELVPSDNDHYAELRKALAEAKAKGVSRRKSVDPNSAVSATALKTEPLSRGTSAVSPRDSPPVSDSVPAAGGGGRRRTVRSEATRNDLLWTRPTPENLQNFAAKGDMAGVANILNVLQKADTESLIAAAKGSHDEVLGILLGMGDPDPDPEPIRSSTHRPGYNTPMLAAIGRGNLAVIRLLLDQKDFNPTRLDHRGLTYYELSQERKGENWGAEYDLLKEAYDNYPNKSSKARKPNVKSPQKTRDMHKDIKRQTQRESPSPGPPSHRMPGRSPDSRGRHSSIQSDAKVRKERRRDEAMSHDSAKARKKVQSQDSERFTASDHDSARVRQGKPKQSSDIIKADIPAPDHTEEPVRRRRLIPGRPPDRIRRRESLLSSDSVSSREGTLKTRTEHLKNEPAVGKESSSLKRPRSSISPEPVKSRGRQYSPEHDGDQHKKKRRVQSEDNFQRAPVEQRKQRPEQPSQVPKPPSRRRLSTTSTSRRAPLTFRSGNTDKEHVDAAKSDESMAIVEDQDQMSPSGTAPDLPVKESNKAGRRESDQPKPDPEVEKRRLSAQLERMRLEAEAQAAKEAKEAEDAARLAREKAEEEELRQKEAERKRIQQLEEERQNLLEQERLRQETLRREMEEQEQRRRDSLPHRLCTAAKYIGSKDPRAKSLAWLDKFMPFTIARRKQIQRDCNPQAELERWVPNYIIAPLLATNDLTLSQYPNWERLPVTPTQKNNLWTSTRNMLSQNEAVNHITAGVLDLQDRINAMKPKFDAMEDVFWVKMEDFMALYRQTPYLQGLKMWMTHIRIDPEPGVYVNREELADASKLLEDPPPDEFLLPAFRRNRPPGAQGQS